MVHLKNTAFPPWIACKARTVRPSATPGQCGTTGRWPPPPAPALAERQLPEVRAVIRIILICDTQDAMITKFFRTRFDVLSPEKERQFLLTYVQPGLAGLM